MDSRWRLEFIAELKLEGSSDKEIAEIIINKILQDPQINKSTTIDALPSQHITDDIDKKLLTIDVFIVDSKIKNSTELWIILIADEQQKQDLISEIKAASATEDTKTKLINDLNAIWEKYPLEYEIKDHTTYIKFKLDYPTPCLSKYDNKILMVVDEIHKKHYGLDNNGNGIKWAGTPGHRNITYWAVYQSVSSQNPLRNYADSAADSSLAPDEWIHLPVDHYYNPDTGLGGAPTYADQYATLARGNYFYLDYSHTSNNLGYSSHFLTDVGNPLHTGKEADQVSHPWVHDAYEGYVSQNWYDFNSWLIDNNYNYKWNWAGGPIQSTKEVATSSHRFVDTLYSKIYYNPSTFQNDSWIREITRVCLSQTSKYTNGLVDYAMLTKFPGMSSYPTDPDQDRFFEDINGNGLKDYDDVVQYFTYLEWIEPVEPYILFDYNMNGLIDFDDLVRLYNEL